MLWGEVRPGTGKRAYKIRIFRSGVWSTLSATHVTDSRGFFRITVTAPKGAKLRLFSPSTPNPSPILTVK